MPGCGGGLSTGLSRPLSCLADPRGPVLSLVSCFAGGVFLGTCLLDLLPDYLDSINAALEGLRVTVSTQDPTPVSCPHWRHCPGRPQLSPADVSVTRTGVSSSDWVGRGTDGARWGETGGSGLGQGQQGRGGENVSMGRG